MVDSTRFTAISRCGDILGDHHEIYVWLYCDQRLQAINLANDLLSMIEAFRSTSFSLSEYQDEILNRASLLIDCHSVGLTFLSLSRGELSKHGKDFEYSVKQRAVRNLPSGEVEKWGIFFQYLLESLLYVTQFAPGSKSDLSTHSFLRKCRNPIAFNVSQWYIDIWTSQLRKENIPVQIAQQSCRTLHTISKTVNLLQLNHRERGPVQTDTFDRLADRYRSAILRLDKGDNWLAFNGVGDISFAISAIIALAHHNADSCDPSSANYHPGQVLELLERAWLVNYIGLLASIWIKHLQV